MTPSSVKRIKLWDQLRGVAILCMIFAHFSYIETKKFYNITVSDFITDLSNPLSIFLYSIHANASYLAPFLFLFTIGVMCNIKFKHNRHSKYTRTLKRTSRLLLGAFLANVVSLLHLESPINADNWTSILFSQNVLFQLLVVYLFNELFLNKFFKYFSWKFIYKTFTMILVTTIVVIFNTKSNYNTAHELPFYITYLIYVYASLLGDYFSDLNPTRYHIRALISAVIAFMLAVIIYCVERPSIGSLKGMNAVYYLYCFGAASGIAYCLLLLKSLPNKLVTSSLQFIELFGRHSLVLYIIHFLIGLSLHRFILATLLPKQYWGVISIPFVTGGCWAIAYLLEFNHNPAKRDLGYSGQ